jgi:hypothetical protein
MNVWRDDLGNVFACPDEHKLRIFSSAPNMPDAQNQVCLAVGRLQRDEARNRDFWGRLGVDCHGLL